MTPTPESTLYALPVGVPSVHLTGRFIAPDGTPLTGSLTFAPPSVLTMPDADTIANTVATVDITKEDQGRFEVNLIATDGPGMSPRNWTYLVTEKLKGAQIRQYHIMLPERPGGDPVDLADLAPVSPTPAATCLSSGPPVPPAPKVPRGGLAGRAGRPGGARRTPGSDVDPDGRERPVDHPALLPVPAERAHLRHQRTRDRRARRKPQPHHRVRPIRLRGNRIGDIELGVPRWQLPTSANPSS